MYDTFMGIEGEVSFDKRLADVCGHLNALHGQLVGLVAEALDTNQWEGYRSPEHWLTVHAGISHGYAHRVVDVARRARELPTVVDAVERGEVTLDQAAVAAKYVPAHNDSEIVGFVAAATVAQLSSTLRRYPFDRSADDQFDSDAAGDSESTGNQSSGGGTATPDSGPSEEPLGERRYCRFGYDDDGSFHLSVACDADDGALIERAMAAARSRLFNGGDTDVTNIDTFLDLANQSLDATDGAGPLDRTRIHLHLDTNGMGVHQGPPIPPSLAERILCDGVLRPVWETEGNAVNVGRDQRIVPERTRIVVEHRDIFCRYPGCAQRRHLEVHHVIHWLYDGKTDTWNLVALCGGHHRAHHRGEFHLVGNADIPDHLNHPDGLKFTHADGSTVYACRRPNAPNAPPPAPADRFQHPTGERFDATLLCYRNSNGTYDLDNTITR